MNRSLFRPAPVLLGGLLWCALWPGAVVEAETASQERPPLPRWRDNSGMVFLRGGEFVRQGGHKVRVRSFYMDRYEVTNEQYCEFLNDGHARHFNDKQEIERDGERFVPKCCKERWPVYGVSWDDAAAYARWAGKRLPTEAEWQWAAGGKEGRTYPWGDDPITPARANFGGRVGHPQPVGSHPEGQTPEGICDLSGNVAEWCGDWFAEDYYARAPEDSPPGPDEGERRVRRGGCWAMEAEHQTAAARGSSRPEYRPACIGFRCVRPARRVLVLLTHSAMSVLADEPPPLAVAPFDAEQAREFQRQWAGRIGKPLVHTNSIGMKMVLIPPGEYTMGRTEEQFDKVLEIAEKEGREPGRAATWEMLMMPAHRVRITKPFYIGATEVTVGQFRQFCEDSGYKTEAEQGLNQGKPYQGGRPICTWRTPMVWIKLQQADDEPVLHLCWNDCVEFCKWLSEKEGVEYCLPTEAEWEYACRAGTTTAWCFGNFEDFDRLGHEYMFVSEPPQGKQDRPSPVARKKPNAFGLYDMHGNVWEYVADWWHRFTYKNSPINDPTGPPEQSEKGDMRRIIRAGSFDWDRWGAQSVYRMRIGQRSTQHPHMGFRVAMRIQGVEGVSPAPDPYEERRRNTIDPGPQKVVSSAVQKHPKELTIDLLGGAKMDFVLIPPGSFLMGSSKGFGDETPVHRVVISKPFYMAKYEVTQSQWEAVMGRHQWLAELTKGDNEMSGPTKAMNVLSWDDCQQFLRKLGEKVPGHRFALPTEAQWEYACRAGSTSEFCFGDDESQLGEYAWYEGNMNWVGKPGFRGKGFYHDVGRKKPNAWGLYDMHGGVWEWCADYYDKDCYVDSPLVDPTGPESGRFRTLRGGSWFRYAKYCRSAYRRFFYPACDGDGVTAWINDFGCRMVINLDE